MIAKNKNNRFAKFMSIFLVGIFALFLAVMPFCFNSRAITDVTYADEVDANSYVFRSSSTVLPVNLCNSDNAIDLTSSCPISLLQLVFTFSVDGLFFEYSYDNAVCRTRLGIAESTTEFLGVSITDYNRFSSITYDTWVNRCLVFNSTELGQPSTSYYVSFTYYIPSNFNFNVSSVYLFREANNSIFGQYRGNGLNMVDSNGAVCRFLFPLSNSNYNAYGNTISYQIPKTVFLDETLTDNQFYQQGYNDGYSNGESAGYNNGNSAGYSAGYSAGRNAGYNDGVVAGGNVSWTNMFGAMVDVPVSSLINMLDFNLNLGGQNFNLYHFLLAVLTLAITIALIRLILAKGGK